MHSAVTLRRTSPTKRCVTRSSPDTPIGLRSAGPVSHDRFLLASGHGAALAREAQALTASTSWRWMSWRQSAKGISESRIRSASRVEREWIQPTSTAVEHRFDAESGRVRAARVERYDAIVLSETPVRSIRRGSLRYSPRRVARPRARRGDDAAPSTSAVCRNRRRLARARRSGRGVRADRRRHRSRAASAIRAEARACRSRSRVDRRPSGRSMTLDYADDGSVSAAVKLQELFGLAESPSIGTARVPVTFHLLAPNGRPVQTTRDLRSFWERTYPEVRKELRGRYPKHPWPEDPWTAQPTHRTTRRAK